jgi:hypothetical protein
MALLHQSGNALTDESSPPARNRWHRRIQQFLDPFIRNPFRQQQHHTRSHHVYSRQSPRLVICSSSVFSSSLKNNTIRRESHAYKMYPCGSA